MTKEADFKKLVRRRMRDAGESYATARANMVGASAGSDETPSVDSGDEAAQRHSAATEQAPVYPFDRFTEHAKQALERAQQEVARARHAYIGTEHLLLALAGPGDGLAIAVLRGLGVRPEKVREKINTVLGENRELIIAHVIPTSRLRRVIEFAFGEAARWEVRLVGTEHLLLGLLLEGQGIAAHVLEDMEVTLTAVWTELAQRVPSLPAAPPSGALPSPSSSSRFAGVDVVAAAAIASRLPVALDELLDEASLTGVLLQHVGPSRRSAPGVVFHEMPPTSVTIALLSDAPTQPVAEREPVPGLGVEAYFEGENLRLGVDGLWLEIRCRSRDVAVAVAGLALNRLRSVQANGAD